MADDLIPPNAPPSLTNSVTFQDGDSDYDKSLKLRYQQSINNLQLDGWVKGCNILTDSAKSVGVVT